MMLQQKNKKIILYIFLFFLMGTLNNKNLNEFDYFKINKISVSGLSEKKNQEIKKKLEVLKFKNLFYLESFQIKKLINSFNHVEDYSVFKNYPSLLKIKLNEADYLAYLILDQKKFYLGSNKKIIKAKDAKKNLPYIFGNFDIEKFFELKMIMDKHYFSLKKIKELYFFPSGRWDLKMNSGVLIKLSRDQLEESLILSIAILKNQNFESIKIIDVRQNNQVIINEK